MKRKVKLHGELGKRFGVDHDLDIGTPAEAVRAFCANYPDFQKFMLDSGEQNVGYQIIVDDEEMQDISHFHLPFSQTVHIVPVIAGAKSGIFMIFEAAVIIVAAVLLAPFTAGTSLSFIPAALGSIAVSLAITGVTQLMAPHPKTDAGSTTPTNLTSYLFNGAVNTTTQGHPVPVGYGRMIVGSAVVSAGITADDYTAAGMT